MRKTLFIILSFLLLNSFLCSAVESRNPVHDIDGNEVRADVEYNVLPVMNGTGGGVTLGRAINPLQVCPRTVVQHSSEVDFGFPLTFTPVNLTEEVILVSTDLNIWFKRALTVCIQSNVWKLDFATKIEQHIIVTNGVRGNPGRETLNNWFKIVEYERDYKLVFCPTVCNFCRPICRDVGIYIGQDHTRFLALSDEPFRVKFKKFKRV